MKQEIITATLNIVALAYRNVLFIWALGVSSNWFYCIKICRLKLHDLIVIGHHQGEMVLN